MVCIFTDYVKKKGKLLFFAKWNRIYQSEINENIYYQVCRDSVESIRSKVRFLLVDYFYVLFILNHVNILNVKKYNKNTKIQTLNLNANRKK